jgi:hypothetical protein
VLDQVKYAPSVEVTVALGTGSNTITIDKIIVAPVSGS